MMHFSNFFLRMSTPASKESTIENQSTEMDQIQDPESASRKRPLSSNQDQVPCKKSMLDRFDMTEKDKTNSWEIKQVLADYATKQMNTYIPDSDIKDEILYTYPIPDNIKNKKEIDANIKSLLLEQRGKETLSLDKAFSSIQDKISNVFGPLSQVWEFLEIQKDNAIDHVSRLKEEEMSEDVTEMLNSSKDCSRIMDMTVTLLGQAINAISYYRRRNALMSIMKGDKAKVKDIMKENKEILQEDTTNRLFGEKFDDRIMEFVKLKKKSKEFFNIMDGKSKVANYPNRSTMNHQSFRGSPLPNTFRGRGQSSYFNS